MSDADIVKRIESQAASDCSCSGCNEMRELAIEVEARFTSLRTELAAMKERMEWRPIETAPGDGTEILVTGINWNDPSRGRHTVTAKYNRCVGGWQASTDWDNSTLEYLTHWMPLPPIPTDTSKETGNGS